MLPIGQVLHLEMFPVFYNNVSVGSVVCFVLLAFVPEKKVKLGMFEVEREREREFQRESSRERERVPEREFQRERAVQREKDSFGSAVKFGPLWFFRSRALAGDAVSAISWY